MQLIVDFFFYYYSRPPASRNEGGTLAVWLARLARSCRIGKGLPVQWACLYRVHPWSSPPTQLMWHRILLLFFSLISLEIPFRLTMIFVGLNLSCCLRNESKQMRNNNFFRLESTERLLMTEGKMLFKYSYVSLHELESLMKCETNRKTDEVGGKLFIYLSLSWKNLNVPYWEIQLL